MSAQDKQTEFTGASGAEPGCCIISRGGQEIERHSNWPRDRCERRAQTLIAQYDWRPGPCPDA